MRGLTHGRRVFVKGRDCPSRQGGPFAERRGRLFIKGRMRLLVEGVGKLFVEGGEPIGQWKETVH
jgi:hypothetical protein